MGIGDWGLGIGPNPQSPIPNPQSPIPNPQIDYFYINKFKIIFNYKKYNIYILDLYIKYYITKLLILNHI